MTNRNFKVGDRVSVIGTIYSPAIPLGTIGKVVFIGKLIDVTFTGLKAFGDHEEFPFYSNELITLVTKENYSID